MADRKPGERRLTDSSYPLSLKTVMARRQLVRDERELWNFLAAQLQLHSGYLIETVPTIDHVITSLVEYKSVLYEDVDLYKSQLKSETSVTTTTMLRILTHINTNLTQLFNDTLYELKLIRNSKRLLASNFSDDTKTELRSIHIKVQALLHQLSSQTYHDSKSRELGNKIQEQIQRLQTPMNCSSARKLLCGGCGRLGLCGLGCIVHHVSRCLVTAYLSNRTMILDCSGMSYSSRGWDAAFLPITNCTRTQMDEGSIAALELVLYEFDTNKKCQVSLVVKYKFNFGFVDGIIDTSGLVQNFQEARQLPTVLNQTLPKTIRMTMPIEIEDTDIFPPAVPRDIFNQILQFNSDPPSWWVGQFKLWAMRMKDEVAQDVTDHLQRFNLTGTVVGLHVRRTDKKREAAYHTLDEYMVHVAEWYDTYELTHPNVDRRVYLATDEAELIKEAKRRYPRYMFIHDGNITSSASLRSRYNEKSLRGTVKDINSLVRCDFVVCTFSSTMCRLVYELAQAKHRGADRFWSIDDTYWVPGGRPVYERVKHDHKPLRQAESEVTKGDVVEFLENHWDGYALISFPKQNQTGLIPAIKIDNIPKMYNYSSKINA